MLPSARWALTPPFHPYRTYGRKRRLARFPFEPPQRRVANRRSILCGTFRSRIPCRELSPACRERPPGVTRRVAPCPERSEGLNHRQSQDKPQASRPAISESGLSSRAASREAAPAIAQLIRHFNYTRKTPEIPALTRRIFVGAPLAAPSDELPANQVSQPLTVDLGCSLLHPNELLESGFVYDWDAELFGLVEFRAGVGAYYYVAGLLAY